MQSSANEETDKKTANVAYGETAARPHNREDIVRVEAWSEGQFESLEFLMDSCHDMILNTTARLTD